MTVSEFKKSVLACEDIYEALELFKEALDEDGYGEVDMTGIEWCGTIDGNAAFFCVFPKDAFVDAFFDEDEFSQDLAYWMEVGMWKELTKYCMEDFYFIDILDDKNQPLLNHKDFGITDEKKMEVMSR